MKETLAYQIAVLHRDFLTYTTETLKKYGLNFGQLPFIVYAGKHPNTTQAAFTHSLKLDWGYSQRSVTKLVELEFMKKEYVCKIGCNCLKLTSKGQEVFSVCHEVFSAWDQNKTGKLTSEEIETLKYLLNKMNGVQEKH